jgi:hypothetical protein
MRSTRRDLQKILADPPTVAVLRLVATGRLPSGDWLGIELRRLVADGLVQPLPDSPATLTPRGQMLLEVANGESACPLDEP